MIGFEALVKSVLTNPLRIHHINCHCQILQPFKITHSMKKLALSTLVILTFLSSALAQSTAPIWLDDKSTNADAAAIQLLIEDLFRSLNVLDLPKAFACYTEESAIVTIEGIFEKDKKKTQENWEGMKKQFTIPPIFGYSRRGVRMNGKEKKVITLWDEPVINDTRRPA